MKLIKKEKNKLIRKEIEQHTMNNSIIIETLVQLLIDKGIVSEKELYEKFQLKIKQLENNINKTNTQILDNDSKLGIYYGPVGEA